MIKLPLFNSIAEVVQCLVNRGLVGVWIAGAILFYSSGWAFAADSGDLQPLLSSLSTARSLTLMIVPGGLQLMMSLSDQSLPQNACAYDIKFDAGPSFSEAVKLITQDVSIDETVGPMRRPPFDIHLGLIFKNGLNIVAQFYFEDRLAGRYIRGYSGTDEFGHQFHLRADDAFPRSLRILTVNPDVVLMHSPWGRCDRS
jgi:hypothetical protein